MSCRKPKRFRTIAAIGAALAVAGCSGPSVLDPQGSVGMAERTILLDSLVIMLAIVLPTIAATFGFAWWFRSSNTGARRLPDWSYSGRLEVIMWGFPILTIMLLGGVTWVSSHDLDPAKPLASDIKPLEIQGVSLDWKWLFIYPDQHVAVVNDLTIPTGVPVHFSLTSASVMNSFFIPKLGSQIYTMNGMATALNLNSTAAGTYHGLASHFSGDGFSDMHFAVHSVSPAEFTAWVDKTRAGTGPVLNRDEYLKLSKPSENVVPFSFHDADAGLFAQVVSQDIPPAPGPAGDETAAAAAAHHMER